MAQKIYNKIPQKKQLPWWIVNLTMGIIAAGVGFYWFSGSNRWQKIESIGIKLPTHYDIHGIDVSHHNGRVDWPRVAKMRLNADLKITFAFIKATEGGTHHDRQFKKNWQAAHQAGISRGAYHFYYPHTHSDLQASSFINTVELQSGDLPPVLDVEVDYGQKPDLILRGIANWLTIIEKHYGRRPIIYTNYHFYNRFIKDRFADYPIWIADYSNESFNVFGAKVLFWQHNENGQVDGIKGRVDFNVFTGSGGEWLDLLKH